MLLGFPGYRNKRITPIKSIDPIQLIDAIYRAETTMGPASLPVTLCPAINPYRSIASVTLIPSATHRAVDTKHGPGGG
jgi:hypothetical protein